MLRVTYNACLVIVCVGSIQDGGRNDISNNNNLSAKFANLLGFIQRDTQ